MRCMLITLVLVVSSPLALAQSEGFAWSENAGWLNWGAGNGVDEGPMVVGGSLSGFVWAENFGWINLGDGGAVPERQNQTGEDFGVGIDDDGYLFGHAWSENTGWITFGPFVDELGDPIEICRCADGITDCADGSCEDARPRLRRGRLLGYAWSANLGWINLDDDDAFVQLLCEADLNADGAATFVDVSEFLTLFAAGSLLADLNDDGEVTFVDVSVFLIDFNIGCP